MNQLFYPLLVFAFYIFIRRNTVIDIVDLDLFIYTCITIWYFVIKKLYGVIAAFFFLIYNSWVNNRIDEGFAMHRDLSGTDIPLHVYQTWHSKDLPPKMAECVRLMKKTNPEFQFHLYDDTDCRNFIADNFEADVLDAYDRIIPGAFKADLWRYCILYDRGGVYLDIKYKCNPGVSLADLTKGEECFVREYSGDGSGLAENPVYTGVMISPPKNPKFMNCIQRIVENVRKKYYGRNNTDPTGPMLFGRFFTVEEKGTMEYSYHEHNKIGYIRDIKKNIDVMSWYPEYREEQAGFSKTKYWKDLWLDREIYL